MSKVPRNIGRIGVSTELIYERPEELAPLFTDFVPVHIEARPHMDDFVYTGYSKQFADRPYNESIPFYTPTITKDEGTGKVTVIFNKV